MAQGGCLPVRFRSHRRVNSVQITLSGINRFALVLFFTSVVSHRFHYISTSTSGEEILVSFLQFMNG